MLRFYEDLLLGRDAYVVRIPGCGYSPALLFHPRTRRRSHADSPARHLLSFDWMRDGALLHFDAVVLSWQFSVRQR